MKYHYMIYLTVKLNLLKKILTMHNIAKAWDEYVEIIKTLASGS